MDKELKDKWVAALRSGDYRQGKGFLYSEGCHCCLGVLCEVSGIPEWDGDMIEYCGEVRDQTIPKPIIDRIGLSVGCADLLIEANDLEGKSFSEIADYIEANL